MPTIKIKQNPKSRKEKLQQEVPHCRAKCMNILNKYNSNCNFNLGMSNLMLVKKNVCKYLHVCVHMWASVCIIKTTAHINRGKCRISGTMVKDYPWESPVVLAWVGTPQELMSRVWPSFSLQCQVCARMFLGFHKVQSLSAPDGLQSLY